MAKSRWIALVVALFVGALATPRLHSVFGLRSELARYGAVPQPDGRLRFTQPLGSLLESELTTAWRAHLASEKAGSRGRLLPSAAVLRRLALRMLNPIAVAIMMVAYALTRIVQRRLPGD